MSEDLFAIATRKKLTFPAGVGVIYTQDLWDLPLTPKKNEPNLDALAQALDKQLKATGETTSFVTKTVKKNETLELQFKVVLEVIAFKVAEEEANKIKATKAAQTKAMKDTLATILAEKKVDGLKSKSVEELEKMFADLA